MTLGIVVQARTGSTRLPQKMTRSFLGEETLLDVVLRRLQRSAHGLPVFLATTDAAADTALAVRARAHGVPVLRGSEHDVLQRFLDAADAFSLEGVVRVCADNPFVDPTLLDDLVAHVHALPVAPDYASHRLPDGTPAIRTHYGCFSEFAAVDALRRAAGATAAPHYREHVTNYLYTHPEAFHLSFLPVPPRLAAHADVRLTVDTLDDFEAAQALYAQLAEHGDAWGMEEVLGLLARQPALRKGMRARILQQSK